MKIDETSVKIELDCGQEFERLCQSFCHIIFQLKRIRDEKLRHDHVNLALMVMDTLEKQFAEKVDNQYRIRK